MTEENYKFYRKSFRTWLTFLIIFTLAGIYYVYYFIIDFGWDSSIYLLIFTAIIFFNYSRIKFMRKKVRDAKIEWENEVKQQIIKGLK